MALVFRTLEALCMVAGTMSGAVRSVILQHFAKGGTLPPGPGGRGEEVGRQVGRERFQTSWRQALTKYSLNGDGFSPALVEASLPGKEPDFGDISLKESNQDRFFPNLKWNCLVSASPSFNQRQCISPEG